MRTLACFLILTSFSSHLDGQPVFFPLRVTSEPLKVAIIDTGMDLNSTWPDVAVVGLNTPKVCPHGSEDFTGTSIEDHHGHGTHIAGLVAKYAEDANYCLVILKYYSNSKDGMLNLVKSNLAFREAIKQRVNIINYSGGGELRSDEECSLVTLALNNGIRVVAAAGNESSDLDKNKFFPAMCDPRVDIVEAMDKNGKRLPSSNYSSGAILTHREQGKNQLSLLPHNLIGYMTGTSQATAVFTGKLVKKLALSTKGR